MHNTVIEENAYLYEVISDQNVLIGKSAQLGLSKNIKPNEKYPEHVFTGLTLIGKKASIPSKTRLYRNTIIEPYVGKSSFENRKFEVGSYIACQ
ncbi:MAG TPA: hypothetical protein ENN22_12625 [bacterium]|nr:hypothetical protein [bacterium]